MCYNIVFNIGKSVGVPRLEEIGQTLFMIKIRFQENIPSFQKAERHAEFRSNRIKSDKYLNKHCIFSIRILGNYDVFMTS